MRFHIIFLIGFILLSSTISGEDFWIGQNLPANESILLIRFNQMDILFASTITETSEGSIYRSFDYATTWENITPDNSFPITYEILISENNTLYLGTWGGGIYRSSNDGDSFEQVNDGLSYNYPIELEQQSNGRIFAGQYWIGGLDYTENEGEYWYPTTFNNWINGLGVDNNDGIFASIDGGVYYSLDDGFSWELRNEGISAPAMQNRMCYAFTENNIAFVGTAEGIFVTENNGILWEYSLSCPFVCQIKIFKNQLFAGTYEDGVYFSNDGGSTWNLKNEGIDSLLVLSFTVDSENFIWCNTPSGIFKSEQELVNIKSNFAERNKFVISPNPCKNRLNVDLNEIDHSGAHIEIYNISGNLVHKSNIKPKTFTQDFISLDVSDLQPGIYLVSINNKNQLNHTSKLIVNDP